MKSGSTFVNQNPLGNRQKGCTLHTRGRRNVKVGYTRVTLPRIVTPYRDSVEGTSGRVTYRKLRGNVTGLFGALLVFGRRIKGMIRLRREQV